MNINDIDIITSIVKYIELFSLDSSTDSEEKQLNDLIKVADKLGLHKAISFIEKNLE